MIRSFTRALTLLAFLSAGCAHGIAKSAQIVAASVHVVGDVENAVAAADKAYKDALVASVKAGKLTPAGAESKNAEWERKLKRCDTALKTFKDAQVTASHVIDLVQHGGKADIASAMQDVATTYSALVQALADIGVRIPGMV